MIEVQLYPEPRTELSAGIDGKPEACQQIAELGGIKVHINIEVVRDRLPVFV